MKKLALFLIIALVVTFSKPVFSQEEDVTVTPTVTDDKIEELKEKVAARVSELKKGKTDGLFGGVKSATDEAFILLVDDNEYSIQLDEDAKVYSIDTGLKKKEIKLSTLEKNSPVSVIGVVDEEENTAVASIVVSRTPNIFIAGTVDEVSTKDGTITISDTNGNSHIVDIETSTSLNKYDPAKNTKAKIGLSAIEKGAKIIVYALQKETEKVAAIRVLILPDSFEPAATPTEKPATTKEPTKTPKPTEE